MMWYFTMSMPEPAMTPSGGVPWLKTQGPGLGLALLGLVAMFGLMPYAFSHDNVMSSVVRIIWVASQSFDGQWEHCVLVPLIAGGLVYWKRRELLKLPVVPSGWGLGILGMGALFYWAGVRTEVVYYGFIALQLMLAGTVVWMLGWAWMRGLAFCWLFMAFAYPAPFLDTVLAFPLRMVMTEVSYHFLNLIGLETIRRGTGLVSAAVPAYGIPAGAKFSVDIADPCSGIRSLFALMMIGALAAYVGLKADDRLKLSRLERIPSVGPLVADGLRCWKRWVLFASALPLAVAGNFARILLLTFGTILFGAELAIGTMEKPSVYHMAAGFLVFAVALSGMLGLWWVLDRWEQWPGWWHRFRQTRQLREGGKASSEDEL